jgi:hypothetical protein
MLVPCMYPCAVFSLAYDQHAHVLCPMLTPRPVGLRTACDGDSESMQTDYAGEQALSGNHSHNLQPASPMGMDSEVASALKATLPAPTATGSDVSADEELAFSAPFTSVTSPEQTVEAFWVPAEGGSDHDEFEVSPVHEALQQDMPAPPPLLSMPSLGAASSVGSPDDSALVSVKVGLAGAGARGQCICLVTAGSHVSSESQTCAMHTLQPNTPSVVFPLVVRTCAECHAPPCVLQLPQLNVVPKREEDAFTPSLSLPSSPAAATVHVVALKPTKPAAPEALPAWEAVQQWRRVVFP